MLRKLVITNQRYPLFFWVTAFLLFAYVILRAIYVFPVHDEIATFFRFVHSGDTFSDKSIMDANNHLLNSYMMQASVYLFGDHPLSLRLPNVLAFPVFAYFFYKLSLIIKDNFLKVVLVLSVFFSHFFIEYFGYARGYGLSMAFYFGALYFLVTYIKKDSLLSLLGLSFCIFLMTLANLSLLLSGFIFSSFSVLFWLIFSRKLLHIPLFLILIYVLYSFAKYGFALKEAGMLYYGRLDGFWEVTVTSIVEPGFGSFAPIVYVLIVLSSLVILSVFTSTIFRAIKMRSVLTYIKAPSVLFPALLMASILGIITLALAFDTNYPEDRVGIYFIPLFLFGLFVSLDEVLPKIKLNKFILALPFLVIPFHFTLSMNINQSTFWYQEHIPQRFYDQIASNNHKSEVPVTVGGRHMRQLVWGLQNYYHGGVLNQIQFNTHPDTIADFQIMQSNHVSIDQRKVYNKIDEEKSAGLVLMERKKKIICELLDSFSKQYQAASLEFIGLLDPYVIQKDSTTILVQVKGCIRTKSKPYYSQLICKATSPDGEIIMYEKNALFYNAYNFEDYTFNFSFYSTTLPKNSSVIVYLWNIKEQQPVTINTTTSLYQLKF